MNILVKNVENYKIKLLKNYDSFIHKVFKSDFYLIKFQKLKAKIISKFKRI